MVRKQMLRFLAVLTVLAGLGVGFVVPATAFAAGDQGSWVNRVPKAVGTVGCASSLATGVDLPGALGCAGTVLPERVSKSIDAATCAGGIALTFTPVGCAGLALDAITETIAPKKLDAPPCEYPKNHIPCLHPKP